MLKNLKYLVAAGLIAFGYTTQANALFDCTTDDAAKGKGFEKCLADEAVAAKNPKYTDLFYMRFCTKAGKGNTLVYSPKPGKNDACESAVDYVFKNKQMHDEKIQATSLTKKRKASESFSKMRQKSSSSLQRAADGEDDDMLSSLKRKFSKSKIEEPQEDEDMEEEEEEEEEEPAPKRRRR